MGLIIVLFFMFLMACVVIWPWPTKIDEPIDPLSPEVLVKAYEDFETFEDLVRNDVSELETLIRGMEEGIEHCRMLQADMRQRKVPSR